MDRCLFVCAYSRKSYLVWLYSSYKQIRPLYITDMFYYVDFIVYICVADLCSNKSWPYKNELLYVKCWPYQYKSPHTPVIGCQMCASMIFTGTKGNKYQYICDMSMFQNTLWVRLYISFPKPSTVYTILMWCVWRRSILR